MTITVAPSAGTSTQRLDHIQASAFAYFRKFWRKIDERVKRRRRRELLLRRKEQLRRVAESTPTAPVART